MTVPRYAMVHFLHFRFPQPSHLCEIDVVDSGHLLAPGVGERLVTVRAVEDVRAGRALLGLGPLVPRLGMIKLFIIFCIKKRQLPKAQSPRGRVKFLGLAWA